MPIGHTLVPHASSKVVDSTNIVIEYELEQLYMLTVNWLRNTDLLLLFRRPCFMEWAKTSITSLDLTSSSHSSQE